MTTAKSALAEMAAHFAKHRTEIDKLVDVVSEQIDADEKKADRQIATSSGILLIILLATISLVAIIMVLISRSLINQLVGGPILW